MSDTLRTAKKPAVLFVDDEPNLLMGLRRTFNRSFDVSTAASGAEALELIRAKLAAGEPFPVVCTDMRMPGLSGVELLEEAIKIAPDTSYIMLTGNADQDTAVQAINRGQVFRFLNKPCPTDSMQAALDAAYRMYELVTAERVLLRDTLTGSIKLLVEALTLTEPQLAKTMKSIRTTATTITLALGLEREWRYPIASSLCLLGFMLLPETTLDDPLSDDRLAACASSGSKLLRHIPRLEPVANMIQRMREPGLLPTSLRTDDTATCETIGARILRFALELERETRHAGGDWASGIKRMKARGTEFDPRLATACSALLAPPAPVAATQAPASVSKPSTASTTATSEPSPSNDPALPDGAILIDVRDLRPSMVVAQDIVTVDGRILVAAGQDLSLVTIERLRCFLHAQQIKPRATVYQPPQPPSQREAA